MSSKDDEVVEDKAKSAEGPKKPRVEKKHVDEAPKKVVRAQKTSEKAVDEKPDESFEMPERDSGMPVVKVTSTDPGTASKIAPIKSRDLRSLFIKVAAVLIVVLAVIIIVFGVLVYGYHSENMAVKTVASIVPYPVEQVNGHFVTYKSYLFEVDANERAYQNNAKLNNQPAVDFNSADGKKLVTQIKQHALDKLASYSLLAQIASQKKVKVTDKEVNDLVNQLYTRYGGKDTLLKTLNQIYGWNLNDLKKVVYKQLLAKDVEDKVTSDPAVDAAAKSKAQAVEKQIKDGGDFAELAKKNSQASDAASGGDLGFFTKGQLPDELQKAAEALQPGQVSDPVKDQYGYEILKIVEKKDDGSIHAMHILIKTVDFNEYFQGELKKAKTTKYLKV